MGRKNNWNSNAKIWQPLDRWPRWPLTLNMFRTQWLPQGRRGTHAAPIATNVAKIGAVNSYVAMSQSVVILDVHTLNNTHTRTRPIRTVAMSSGGMLRPSFNGDSQVSSRNAAHLCDNNCRLAAHQFVGPTRIGYF